MLYAVSCDNLGTSFLTTNRISGAFNSSSRVTSWIKASDHLWLVDGSEGTEASDIRDLVLAASDRRASAFVAPFESASFVLPRADEVKTWIERCRASSGP